MCAAPKSHALPDLTIAAGAITNGLHFATDNPKDFPIPDLRLYQLPRLGSATENPDKLR